MSDKRPRAFFIIPMSSVANKESTVLRRAGNLINLLQFLKKNPQHTIVVLAGTGHSWKPGIPEQVELQSKGITYQVILPEIQDHLNPQMSPSKTPTIYG